MARSCVAAALLVAGAVAQDPGAAIELTIQSPPENTYISGPIRLQAIVSPLSAVSQITGLTFFADGIVVCRLERPPLACDWDAGPTVEEHHIRAVATLRSGGRLVANVRTKRLDHAEKVDVDVVQVTATVTNGRGRFVPGLRREDFRVFEDDVRQPVTQFLAENVPLELLAAIDISGSMRLAIPELKEAVKEFLAAVPPTNEVTLIGFNDNIFPLTRRSRDPEARLRAVDRLAAWGGTALYDVIIRGIEMLDQATGRKALVVFSDGEDQGSHATRDDTLRRLEETDATLYMIGQGQRASAPDLRALMERLAKQSGGRAFFPDRIEDLRSVFGEIIEDLSNQYLISYAPIDTVHDGTWRTIRVELVDRSYRVRAREGYRAKPPGR